MNYNISEIPNSGNRIKIWLEILLDSKSLGNIYIELQRDLFPAGVENFVHMIKGDTYRNVSLGIRDYKYVKQYRRSYANTSFFHAKYSNYIIGGDIYNDTGTNAGTIYNDVPIPAIVGEDYIPHDKKGLISLVSYLDEDTGKTLFDSTFMITLEDESPRNNLSELDKYQVVIGYVYDGLDILDTINKWLQPIAGKRKPKIKIGDCDIVTSSNGRSLISPDDEERKKIIRSHNLTRKRISRNNTR